MAEPSGSGTAGYFLRVEYTTFEFEGEYVDSRCVIDPNCICLNPGSGSSGSGSGSGSGTPPNQEGCVPDASGNICVPSWFMELPEGQCFNINSPSLTTRQFIAYQSWGVYCQTNGSDPPGGGGGSGGTGEPTPVLVVEYTTFDMPESTRIVSRRCVDEPICNCV